MARGRIVFAVDAQPVAPSVTAPVLPAFVGAANDVVRDAFGGPARPAPTPEERLRAEAARLDEERRALEAERAQLQALQKLYFERAGQLAAAAQALTRPQPEAVVDLALVVARELIGREVAIDRKHFIDMLASELLPVCDSETLDVRLPPREAAMVAKLHPELAARVRLVADDKLAAGDCIVESPTSVIDRSLGARIHAVRAALILALSDRVLKRVA